MLSLLLLCLPSGLDEYQVFPVDPVELVRGREVPGQESLVVRRGLFEYRFTTPATREAFLAAPEQFEIQFGGGCARMGPLSGVGQTDIYAVYGKRIYIFASQACRRGFLKDPESLLERPDPRPSPTDQSAARAHLLLDRAAARMGMPDRPQGSLTHTRKRTVVSGDREYRNSERIVIVFPDKFRRDSTWDHDTWSYITVGPRGWFEDLGNYRPMEPTQVRAFQRRFDSDPVVLLASRRQKGFVAESLAPVKIDGKSFDCVRTWFRGTLTTLLVDQNGDIHRATFRERGSSGFMQVERRYSGFQDIDGWRLPTTVHVFNDGKPTGREPTRWTVAVNAPEADRLFQKPAPRE